MNTKQKIEKVKKISKFIEKVLVVVLGSFIIGLLIVTIIRAMANTLLVLFPFLTK